MRRTTHASTATGVVTLRLRNADGDTTNIRVGRVPKPLRPALAAWPHLASLVRKAAKR